MNSRISIHKYLASEQGKAMIALGSVEGTAGIERTTLELVRLRTSQINGCAYCIDMHTKDARVLGETEQRLYGLSAWHEAPYYTERERAALEWTETIALVAEGPVPDDVYERVRKHFDEQQLVALTFVAVGTNAWNRVVKAFKIPAGTYQPKSVAA